MIMLFNQIKYFAVKKSPKGNTFSREVEHGDALIPSRWTSSAPSGDASAGSVFWSRDSVWSILPWRGRGRETKTKRGRESGREIERELKVNK